MFRWYTRTHTHIQLFPIQSFDFSCWKLQGLPTILTFLLTFLFNSSWEMPVIPQHHLEHDACVHLRDEDRQSLCVFIVRGRVCAEFLAFLSFALEILTQWTGVKLENWFSAWLFLCFQVLWTEPSSVLELDWFRLTFNISHCLHFFFFFFLSHNLSRQCSTSI